jgi:chromosome segregation ATPase
LKEKNVQLETQVKEQAEIQAEAAPRLSVSENFDMEQEIFKNFENAISSLNIELQKSKPEEHKMKTKEQDLAAEVSELKEREAEFKIQIQQVHQAMDFLAAESGKKIDEKNGQVKTLEEYAEGYRQRISFLEE